MSIPRKLMGWKADCERARAEKGGLGRRREGGDEGGGQHASAAGYMR